MTSEMRKRLNQLAPIIWDGTSVPTLVSERTSVMIIETGSGSVLLVPTPAMDILEEPTPPDGRAILHCDKILH